MAQNSLRSSLETSLLSLALILSSCATNAPLHIEVPQLGLKPLPLRAGLVVPESIGSTNEGQVLACLNYTFDVSIGAEFEEGAMQALGQAFDQVELVEGRPEPGRYDVLVELADPKLFLEGSCDGPSGGIPAVTSVMPGTVVVSQPKNRVEAQATISVIVKDKAGHRLLDIEGKSGTHTKSFGAMSAARPYVKEAIGEALSDMLQQMTKNITASPKLLDHAKSLTGQ